MVRMGTVRRGLPWAPSLRPGLHQTGRTNADTKRERFSARALPSELFRFVLTAATSNDGAHGHGAAVGAVGVMFHVRKCAKCTVVGARATGATRTARLDNMNSGVHRVDMKIWAPRTRTPSHDTAASPSSLGVSPP